MVETAHNIPIASTISNSLLAFANTKRDIRRIPRALTRDGEIS